MAAPAITEADVLKYKLLKDLYFFTRYFHKKTTGSKFIPGRHFEIMSEYLEAVYRHEITRLVITMPPRFGKTEMGVVNFMAKGFALNAASRFIHTSYSDNLVLENSERIQDIIMSDHYQCLFPITLKKDSTSKKRWHTSEGGGVLATPSGGAITGFGAGKMEEYDDEAAMSEFISSIEKAQGFAGAIIMDDTIKPEDAASDVIRKRVNERIPNTIMSRVNSDRTPIIGIGQRVHKDDSLGLLIDMGFEHLNLPAKTNGVQLWDYRKNVVDEAERLFPSMFLTQYQQAPQDIPNDRPFFYAYSPAKFFIEDKIYTFDRRFPIDISFDFNKDPCVAILSQYHPINLTYAVKIAMKATPATFGTNVPPLKALCVLIKKSYIDTGEIIADRIEITGDGTGTRGTAGYAERLGMYSMICETLDIGLDQVKVRKTSGKHGYNLPHRSSSDQCNEFLGRVPKGHFVIYSEAYEVNQDLLDARADKDGSLVKDRDNNKNDIADAMRYQIDKWFPFETYKEMLLEFCNKVEKKYSANKIS